MIRQIIVTSPGQLAVALADAGDEVGVAIDAARAAAQRRQQSMGERAQRTRREALERLRPGVHHVDDDLRAEAASERDRGLRAGDRRNRRDNQIRARQRRVLRETHPLRRVGAVAPDAGEADISRIRERRNKANLNALGRERRERRRRLETASR